MRCTLGTLALALLILAGCSQQPPQAAPGSTTTAGGASSPAAATEEKDAGAKTNAAMKSIDINPENSTITFVATRDDQPLSGAFPKFAGKADLDLVNSQVHALSLEIDMTALTTDDEALTSQLQGADFFNVGEHPTATFESTKIEHEGRAHTVTGNLTLHGQTKEITFAGKAETPQIVMIFTAEMKVDGRDFGIGKGDESKAEQPITIKLTMGKSPGL